jgi:hypothetical protein
MLLNALSVAGAMHKRGAPARIFYYCLLARILSAQLNVPPGFQREFGSPAQVLGPRLPELHV